MRISAILLSLLLSLQVYAADKFETYCKQGDCFRHGWLTTGDSYSLDTVCKNNDCSQYGWSSLANDQSTYDVTCKKGGCFVTGWHSSQLVDGVKLDDEVSCKSGQCLVYGWTVQTGYDLMGGDVTCHQNDCSKYGGYSFWRGRDSHTSCYHGDCYHYGWSLYID